MQPFRFGVIGETVRTPADLTDRARRAEDLGYSTLLLRDHFVEEPFGHQLAPLIALTAAASVTTTLRVGTQVLANDYRHPVMLAKEAATLDLLSGGRLELGIGAGWLRDEYASAGMAFDAAGERVGRLEESIQLLKSLFGTTPTHYAGEHYTVAGLDTFPAPVQRPHPPLMIGAGSKRMLRLAGREADIVGVLSKALPDGTISGDVAERRPDTMAQKVAWIREGAGDRAEQVELSMMISPVIADDVRESASRFADARGWDALAADEVLAMPSVFIGPAERIMDLIRQRREEYGFSYYVVSDRAMDAFAPVVAKLSGD
ncbi:TIGR03621 family F420-dependent LLM class oxidoreductase [Phytoactinopolyspora alkaliphila]|uniref:TIGR03621 family F420-dependent LLM class oxidoreductase n=1 Tax=Phytoactinopolyspora alkaliphila TaxID=1783498 RepID=A0A6N9YHX4_9ACTN|nr:TIGR03621 family F420-dependent LLM class oxidoreductase [Phytoactinopolyspora alkaliphila]NED94603.1 TIGR03621 family F420-dependent LLM class oxidoreductase [Phytoactinopolyspora alkaliphila]